MSETEDATDGRQYKILCTECGHAAYAISKSHAHALGRKHYHQEGHPVLCEEVDQ